MLKVGIHNEDIIFIKIYAPSNTGIILIKQKLQKMQGDTDRKIFIIENFYTILNKRQVE